MTVPEDMSRAWREAIREAGDFVMPPDWAQSRERVDGITIDDDSTRDRDDAIWYEPNNQGGVDITVSIADVGSFISPNSKIAAHALALGETRYVKSSPRPMLPREIGEQALSLLETHVAPAVTVDISLDSLGQVIDSDVRRTAIRPLRTTYQEIAGYTHAPEHGDDPRVDIFKAYERLALQLLQGRQAQGAFAYYNLEQGVMTDEDGRLITFQAGVEHSGQLIVQEFMILANTVLAAYMRRHEIPGIFRRHQLPEQINVEEAVALLQSGQINRLGDVRRQMGRAWYTTEAGTHDALKVPAYVHGTSPLRRFADLANQWNIVAHIAGEPFPLTSEALGNVALHANDVQAEIRGPVKHFQERDRKAGENFLITDTEQLTALTKPEFHAAVKAAVRTGQAPANFQQAVEARTNGSVLPIDDMSRLMTLGPHNESWTAVRMPIMRRLVEQPSIASQILNIAFTKKFISDLVIAPTPTNQGYTWTIRFKRDGIEYTGTGEHTQSNSARHLAAVDALAQLTNITVTRAEPKPTEHQSATTTNPKSMLNEHAQKAGVPPPCYTITTEWTDGTEHLFRADVTLGETNFTGHGRTKKAAEAAAAKAAIDTLNLNTTESAPDTNIDPAETNPISWIQERSARLRHESPVYTFHASGPPHQPVYICEVTVRHDDGSEHTYTDRGASKTAAKTAAARIAAKALYTP